jgi:hypothetical protein
LDWIGGEIIATKRGINRRFAVIQQKLKSFASKTGQKFGCVASSLPAHIWRKPGIADYLQEDKATT